jgi:F420-0:gamma-glutamyl ligase-like protein
MLVGRHSTVLMGWRLAGIQYMRRDADNESLAIMQIMIEVADESLLGARAWSAGDVDATSVPDEMACACCPNASGWSFRPWMHSLESGDKQTMVHMDG